MRSPRVTGMLPELAGTETHSHAWLCTLRTGSHMNPDALTDQFDLAVLETGNFSAAARRRS